jgi:hypothetical protein
MRKRKPKYANPSDFNGNQRDFIDFPGRVDVKG